MINGEAKVAGIIGMPVAHSLSPTLHNYWLKFYGLNGVYVPLPVKPENLERAIRALPALGLRGANVTVPHKETVMKFLDKIDPEAQVIGAVNTIVVGPDGSLRGSNTDVFGFTKLVRPHLPARKKRGVILGAGGAARAVCQALLKEGFTDVTITNRTPERARELVTHFNGKITSQPWENRANTLRDADILVNATSVSTVGSQPFDIELGQLPNTALVVDISYAGAITALLDLARARGNPVLGGLGMLLHQAVPGFEAWFGIRPQVTDDLAEHIMTDHG